MSLKQMNPVPKIAVSDKQWFFICLSLIIAIIARKKKGDLALHTIGMVS